MNYAYWFANIPGLSNCAKISIHEKVGNAQDIYFLSEKQMENLQLLAKEIQAVRAAQKTDMEEAYAKMCESGISFVSLEDASYPKRLRHIANPPYGLYVKGMPPAGRDRCDCRCENVLRIRADGCKGARENACGARRR